MSASVDERLKLSVQHSRANRCAHPPKNEVVPAKSCCSELLESCKAPKTMLPHVVQDSLKAIRSRFWQVTR